MSNQIATMITLTKKHSDQGTYSFPFPVRVNNLAVCCFRNLALPIHVASVDVHVENSHCLNTEDGSEQPLGKRSR